MLKVKTRKLLERTLMMLESGNIREISITELFLTYTKPAWILGTEDVLYL